MTIEERDLLAFVRMAELGSLQKVAERLHVSAPTASRRLRHLSESLGIELLQASGRSLELTEAGRAFLPRAREALSAWSEVRHFPETFGLESRKPLRLIAFTRYALPLLVPAVSELLPRLSGYRVRIDVHSHRDFSTSRHMHPFDFGVGCLSARAAADLVVRPLGESPLVACVAAGSKWGGRKSIAQGDLAGEKFICLPGDTLIGSVVRTALPFLAPGDVLAETSNTLVAVGMVAQFGGVHVTDCLAAEPFLSGGCHAMKIEGCSARLSVSCFWPREGGVESELAEVFYQTIKRIFIEKTGPFLDGCHEEAFS